HRPPRDGGRHAHLVGPQASRDDRGEPDGDTAHRARARRADPPALGDLPPRGRRPRPRRRPRRKHMSIAPERTESTTTPLINTERARDLLAAEGLDGLITATLENSFYFSGIWNIAHEI